MLDTIRLNQVRAAGQLVLDLSVSDLLRGCSRTMLQIRLNEVAFKTGQEATKKDRFHNIMSKRFTHAQLFIMRSIFSSSPYQSSLSTTSF